MKTMTMTMMLVAVTAMGQSDGPQPPHVASPGTKAPSDAVVLFDGKDMSGWAKEDGSPAGCKVEKGEMVCASGVGDIVSKELFTDAQIHVEFNIPLMSAQKGQMRGNSGVYLHSCYEVQILDSYENPTYANGSCGAVYGFAPPLVNASRRPGEWQSYDIIFRAPQCDGTGGMSQAGSVTILHNGVLVQDGTKLDKKGPGCTKASVCGPGPLRLQDHSGFPNAPHTVMKFRNIWLRKLSGK
ncbi:MAG: DUF1080 domain-containing protein [Acidobacteriia bacterium]|nr:DUF1080 domain-containing protein [Terriglobia bacterium]